jgi:pentatricopeptide repeat protein
MLNAVVSALKRSGKLQEARKLLSRYSEFNAEPDRVTTEILLDLAGYEHDIKTLESILESTTPSIVMYNIALKHYAKAKYPNKLLDTFEKILKSGCTPDKFTFSILLSYYGKMVSIASTAIYKFRTTKKTC